MRTCQEYLRMLIEKVSTNNAQLPNKLKGLILGIRKACYYAFEKIVSIIFEVFPLNSFPLSFYALNFNEYDDA